MARNHGNIKKWKKYGSMQKIAIVFLFMMLGNCFLYFPYLFAAENPKEFISITAPSAVVIDFDTGRVLYGKNETEKRKMASLTKIITSILLVETCQMDELIEVPPEATWIGGSTVGLKKGDKVSAKSLLYGMLLPSGNDCAYTVGLHIGGTIENFAKMMTKKVKELGIEDTSFANPHGLDHEEHYSSAKSLALITRYALKNKYINEAVKTKSITINFGSFSKLLNNTNALLRTYPYADGVKTGFTNGANRCLVASATKDNQRYIAVVLGAETTQIRFGDAKKILDACFERYKKIDISTFLNFYFHIPVIKGSLDYYERKYEDTLSYPLMQEEIEKISIRQDMISKIEAPMNIGSKIGTFSVHLNDEILYKKDVFLEEDINKKTMFEYFIEGIKNMFQEVSLL